MSRLKSSLAGVTGTAEETDLIKLRLRRASTNERSYVGKKLMIQPKILHSGGLRRLGGHWTSAAGKQRNRNTCLPLLALTFYSLSLLPYVHAFPTNYMAYAPT